MRAEHEVEPVRGLPEPLPPGERMLWQGSPCWRSLARSVLHADLLAGYFGLLIAVRGFAAYRDGAAPADALLAALGLAPWALAVMALVLAYAWGAAAATVYTITDRRVVMRFGLALPLALNIPFRQIDAAALKLRRDGTGDIPLTPSTGCRVGWLLLWPHARPWRLSRPEPMLRAVPEAARVAEILAAALKAQVTEETLAAAPVPRVLKRPAEAARPVRRAVRSAAS